MNSEACRETSQRGVSAESMLSQREIQTMVCREAQNEEDMFSKYSVEITMFPSQHLG